MMRPREVRARLALLLMCLACHARAQEPASTAGPPSETRVAALDPGRTAPKGPQQVQLDASAIRGNQELPKVLYIVPWKDPAMVEFAGRPANSLVEEILAPVDREVFRRQVRYFDQLYGDGQGPAAATRADPQASGAPTGK
jgi:hypothetical protein